MDVVEEGADVGRRVDAQPLGGIVGNGSFLSISNSFYNAELNANRVMGGFGNPGFGSYYHNASTGLTTAQMDDVSHYADGTITQVLADRAEAAQRAQQQAEMHRQEAMQLGGLERQQAARGASSQADDRDNRPEGTSMAALLDARIVVKDGRRFSADVRRIEVDGQVYLLEDSGGEEDAATPR